MKKVVISILALLIVVTQPMLASNQASNPTKGTPKSFEDQYIKAVKNIQASVFNKDYLEAKAEWDDLFSSSYDDIMSGNINYEHFQKISHEIDPSTDDWTVILKNLKFQISQIKPDQCTDEKKATSEKTTTQETSQKKTPAKKLPKIERASIIDATRRDVRTPFDEEAALEELLKKINATSVRTSVNRTQSTGGKTSKSDQ